MTALQGFRVYVVGVSQDDAPRLVRNVKALDRSQADAVAIGLCTGIEVGQGDELINEDFKVVVVDLDALAAGTPEWAWVDALHAINLPSTQPEHLPEDDTVEDAEERCLYQIGVLIREAEAGAWAGRGSAGRGA